MRYDKGEWEEWVEIVKKREGKLALCLTPLKYRPLVAACLSVAKWKDTPGGNCGLCDYYWSYPKGCGDCPLLSRGQYCSGNGSLWQQWLELDSGRKRELDSGQKRELVKSKMHALLLEIYEAEYKRVIG